MTDQHEQLPSFQAIFFSQVNELVAALEKMGNLFIEDNHYFFVFIDSDDIMSEEMVKTVRESTRLGQQKHSNFIEKCLVKRELPMTDLLPRSRLALFSNKQPWPIQKTSLSISESDFTLFARLYIPYQARNGDVEKIFQA
ncbi:hypothetical protein PoB_001354600 [Plakobranchus ocellatus]|uniref:Uncharacterized protein n=1 Tax=Plakobranchus ocellatus TaxID=259542 RepID=A0AAV3YXC8_9GAST|nr:hypothetical protein PoB_001354600 [Plakobranchus ocellatus]